MVKNVLTLTPSNIADIPPPLAMSPDTFETSNPERSRDSREEHPSVSATVKLTISTNAD